MFGVHKQSYVAVYSGYYFLDGSCIQYCECLGRDVKIMRIPHALPMANEMLNNYDNK